MQRTVFSIALLSVCCLSVSAQAQESWWNRLNPFRRARSAPARDAGGMNTQRIENLRSRMTERGIDEAVIDQRIERITTNGPARPGGTQRPGRRPTAAELRERLEQRGINTAQIDERLARIRRPSNSPPVRRGFAMGTEAPPSIDRLREIWQAGGLTAEQIEQKVIRAQRELNRPIPTEDDFVADHARPIPTEDGFVADHAPPADGFVADRAEPVTTSGETRSERAMRLRQRYQRLREAAVDRRGGLER